MNPYILSIILLLLLLFIRLISYNVLPNYKKYKYSSDQIVRIFNIRSDKLIKMYYINLDISIDRKNRMLSKLPNNINPIRVSAITPKTLPKLKLPLSCKISLMDYSNKILACTCSHLKAIHTAYHNNDLFALIAEDDIIILKNINWDILALEAPKDWDIIQIHSCCHPLTNLYKNFQPIYKYHNSNILFLEAKNNMIGSAALYLINRNGMKKILSRYISNYLDSNWNNIKLIDFTKTTRGCEADDLIFNNINRYIFTQIISDVEGLDSTLHPLHVNIIHKNTKDYINSTLNNLN